MKFYCIYKSLAHPETNGFITPFTLEERLMHVAEAQRQLGSQFEWICDSMDNDLKHALGDAPNSEFVIGPDGTILVARQWSNPNQLRNDLIEPVGDVERPTTIDQLGMKPVQPPKTAPKGIVPRLSINERLTPLSVEPQIAVARSGSSDPFYVKLRAEISQPYFQNGSGQLYLGFFLDPLYQVHWNNQTEPMEFEIEAPPGVQVQPATHRGPKVEQPADADPREFLLEITGTSDEPLRLTLKYIACDDAETFCKPVTQHYEITLQRDRDGGSRRAAGGRGPRGGPPGGFNRPDNPQRNARPDPQSSQALRRAVTLFKRRDTDRNGRLDADELADVTEAPIRQADADKDGEVTLREVLDWMKNRR